MEATPERVAAAIVTQPPPEIYPELASSRLERAAPCHGCTAYSQLHSMLMAVRAFSTPATPLAMERMRAR